MTKHLRANWLWSVYIFLPVLTALIQYCSNNSVYSLAGIVAAVALLMVFRHINRILVWETCLIIVLFTTPSAVTWLGLAYIGENSLQYYTNVQSSLDTPNSGLEVLPVQVRQIRYLLISHHASTYQLSPELQEAHVLQRTMEAAWPIKLDPVSAYHIRLIGEKSANPYCSEIDSTAEVVLDFCP